MNNNQINLLNKAKGKIYLEEEEVLNLCKLANIEVCMFICSIVQSEFYKIYSVSLTKHPNGKWSIL